jgi:hypothetical protein
VLILPPGHGQTILAPRRFTVREKWMIGGVLGTVAALAVAVVIAIASGGHRSAHGCVDVTVPYSIGGQEFYKCGSGAVALCRMVDAPNGFSGKPAREVAAACRKGGVPVGSAQ